MKKLIEVHCQDEKMISCSFCDGESEETSIFYKECIGTYFSPETYLKCCLEKVGKVVDWYSLEEYEKCTGKIGVAFIEIKKIKGYVAD